MIGSAASAVQFVPEIAKPAVQIHLFQRTANWVLSPGGPALHRGAVAAFRADPVPVVARRRELLDMVEATMTFANPAMVAQKQAVALAAIEVGQDPAVRRKLIPDHPCDGTTAYLGGYHRQLSEPVHAVWAQHQRRFHPGHDRVPGRPRRPASAPRGRRRPPVGGREARGMDRYNRELQ